MVLSRLSQFSFGHQHLVKSNSHRIKAKKTFEYQTSKSQGTIPEDKLKTLQNSESVIESSVLPYLVYFYVFLYFELL